LQCDAKPAGNGGFFVAAPMKFPLSVPILGKSESRSRTMNMKSFAVAALAALAVAAPAMAADGYKNGDERAPRGSIVVSERAQYMSFYDYFFNNPGKSRTLRYDPGEYYKGLTREYDRP
jgi:hypothetical protein